MIVLCFFTLLRVLLSFSVVAGSQIYISKRQRLHTGTQIQIAFLAFCFHHHRFKAKCSLSLSIASRIKPFVLAFFCVILWFLDGSGFFLYQHRWCLACVYCSLSLSRHTFEFVFERSLSFSWLVVCACVFVWLKLKSLSQLYIDSIMVALKGIVAKNENERKNGRKKTRNSTNTFERIDTESPSTNT